MHFFLKGKYGLLNKLQDIGIENCSISEITLAELKYGVIKSKNLDKHAADIIKITELFNIIPISDSLDVYANERYRLEKNGNRIPDFDILIGSTAIKNEMTLVTSNEKHMNRLAEIKLENWTKSEFNIHSNS